MDDKTTLEPMEGQSVLPGFEGVTQAEEERHAYDVVKDAALEQLAAEAEKSTRRKIYDPVQKHYTQDQRDRLAALEREENIVIEEIHKYTDAMQEAQRTGNNQLINELMGKTTEIMAKKYDPITTAQTEIHRAAEQVYIDSFQNCEDITAAIMADVKEILGGITKQHYLVYQMKLSDSLGQALREPDKMSKEDAAAFRTLSEMAAVSISNCVFYLYQNVRVQANAFSYYGLDMAPFDSALEDLAASFFPDQASLQPAGEFSLAKISYKNSKGIKTVTDKLMNVFFSLTAPTGKDDLNGQRAMIPLKYEGPKSKREITLYYDFTYNEDALTAAGIPKGFGSYEFFVATALDNLLDNGNEIVTYSKILEEIGSDSGEWYVDKLQSALLKGATTTIYINDADVQKAWGNSDRYREIVSPVFPIKIMNERYIANGFIADGAVKILDYSPFRSLAGSLGHLTQWDKKILQLYTGRRTDRYWNVLQFLIREIGWMRNPKSKRGRKILYTTLYAHAEAKTTRAKQLTRDMMYRLLDEVFIPTGYVTSYKEDDSTKPGAILTLGTPLLHD